MDELCRQRFESYYKKLYDEVFKVINRFWMNQYIKNMQLTDEIVAIFASEQNNFLNVLGNKLQSGEFVAIKSRKTGKTTLMKGIFYAKQYVEDNRTNIK
jgi:hypothetical protein